MYCEWAVNGRRCLGNTTVSIKVPLALEAVGTNPTNRGKMGKKRNVIDSVVNKIACHWLKCSSVTLKMWLSFFTQPDIRCIQPVLVNQPHK